MGYRSFASAPSGLLFTSMLLAGALCACQHTDPAVERSERQAALLADTRQTTLQGDQVVQQSQASLQVLRNTKGDLRPAFESFLAQADAVRDDAARMKREGERVKAQNAAYCDARQRDVKTISNDEMRQAAEERTARIKQHCDDVAGGYAKVNTAFDRYLRSLADLQTYLGTELNYNTLDSGKKWIDEAIASGEQLRHDIRDLAGEIELTGSTLAPIPVAATQWPATLQSATVPTSQPTSAAAEQD